MSLENKSETYKIDIYRGIDYLKLLFIHEKEI